jgi:hypothetical protein
MLEIHLYIDVTDLLGVKIDFHLSIGFDVPKASELVEVTTEGIPGVVDDIVSFIEGRSSEVLIDWVDLKALERINRSNGMLPHISHHIVELPCLEHINGIGRHPILHIHIPYLLIFPVCMILLECPADRVVFVLSGQTNICAHL